ncbi:carbonic anhydrase [Aeromicrobium camelliae]|uniref:carbonic anhydrase n=1 Tax=Aeromicrobium camelliae TaxID=1538144 RepID=A0A3N6WU67_9ACTN|nr:carbonic anhydrase [Aeromicrobium camelliae]RQN08512.1 carbonic anhydrase [Aeromicrobium camelliae]
MSSAFDDLLDANRTYAEHHDLKGFDGIAHAGVAMVTCMDSRIDPLRMIGLSPGDAKILRNPGGRVTDQALVAVVLGVTLLNVRRVLVVEHTRCAMASSTEDELHERISDFMGTDSTWMSLGAIQDQEKTIRADVHRVRSHPLVPADVSVGGFIYDVDSGLLQPVVEA